MISVLLPTSHYASQWPTEGVVKTVEEVTRLGTVYAESKDSAVLLDLCRCFHPYLMKYLVMICRGHVPVKGVGKNAFKVNSDVEPFLRFFLPKGEELNKGTTLRVVMIRITKTR